MNNNKCYKGKGCFVISLDFEMMWGCHDWATPYDYGFTNVKQVRNVISRMLDLFGRYNVHATFACVGLLFCKDKNEAIKQKPSLLPTYADTNKSPFKSEYIESIADEYSKLYFADDVIEELKKYPNIEIGTHTFSHYYCWEPGQTVEQFASDLDAAIAMAEKFGVKLKSIVFPKNEVSQEYLDVCVEHGITCYRGNASRFYDEPSSRFQALKQRVGRLVDAYFNIGGNTSISMENIELTKNIINIQASRFLRPSSKLLAFAEPLRLRRIKQEMRYAARQGELYHLWWHPHNFGDNLNSNFEILERILKCFSECRDKYNMKSYTMDELSMIINK